MPNRIMKTTLLIPGQSTTLEMGITLLMMCASNYTDRSLPVLAVLLMVTIAYGAFRDSAGSFMMVYSLLGTRFSVSTQKLKPSKIKASWYNPRNGDFGPAIASSIQPIMTFSPPSSGPENDWVLVLNSVQ